MAAVLRWVASNIGGHGGDPTRVILAGESAGATHAATCALVRRLGPGADAAPLGVAVVSGGGYNPALEGLAREQFGIATPDPRNEAYFGPDPMAWTQMGLVDLADADPFPLFISYAELDPAQMQVQSGELFAHLVRRCGFAPTLRVIRGHDHLSQLYSIGTGDASLLQPLLTWMRRLPGMQQP